MADKDDALPNGVDPEQAAEAKRLVDERTRELQKPPTPEEIEASNQAWVASSTSRRRHDERKERREETKERVSDARSGQGGSGDAPEAPAGGFIESTPSHEVGAMTFLKQTVPGAPSPSPPPPPQENPPLPTEQPADDGVQFSEIPEQEGDFRVEDLLKTPRSGEQKLERFDSDAPGAPLAQDPPWMQGDVGGGAGPAGQLPPMGLPAMDGGGAGGGAIDGAVDQAMAKLDKIITLLEGIKEEIPNAGGMDE